MDKQEILVKWIHPEQDWVKLNTDGSCRDKKTACGGVLRNRFGSWLTGFSRNTDTGNSLNAELWGIFIGLDLSWQLGFRKIWLEVDSMIALQLIKNGCNMFHPNAQLIHEIRLLLARNWNVFCSHTYREGNRVADQLSKLGHEINNLSGIQVFDRPPNKECDNLILQDMIGVLVPRHVRA